MYRNMDFGLVGASSSPQRNETLTLTFLVFSEPHIPLLGMGEARLTAAYDNDKNSMLIPVNNNPNQAMFLGGGFGRHYISRYGNGNRSYMQQSQFQLHRPSERATPGQAHSRRHPRHPTGRAEAVVVADNILKAKGKKSSVGTTTFHFEEVSAQANKQYQIKLAITEDNKDNPNDWTWMQTLFQRIELQDEKGNKFQVYGTAGTIARRTTCR